RQVEEGPVVGRQGMDRCVPGDLSRRLDAACVRDPELMTLSPHGRVAGGVEQVDKPLTEPVAERRRRDDDGAAEAEEAPSRAEALAREYVVVQPDAGH